MSRQSKQARNQVQAKAASKQRQNGTPGPAKTTPKHGKRWTYRTNPEIQKRLAEMFGTVAKGNTRGTRGGKKVLEGAGKAAQ